MWKKQFYSLNSSNKTMEVHDTEEEYQHSDSVSHKNLYINLIGVQYAKEWSVVIPDSDVGFDIVWDSGNIWSFLVESESMCSKWVKYLNKCSVNEISDINAPKNSQEQTNTTTFIQPQDETQFPNNLTATPIMPRRTMKHDPNNLTSLLNNPMHGNMSGSNPIISPIQGSNSQSDSAKSTNTSSPNSDTNEIQTQSSCPTLIPQPPSISQNQNQPTDRNAHVCQTTVNTDSNINTSNIPPPPPMQSGHGNIQEQSSGVAISRRENVPNDNLIELEKKYKDITQSLQRERVEAEIAREQLVRVHHEMEARSESLERDLKHTRDTEMKKSQEVRDEIQKRFIEASNENIEIHQQNIKSMQMQHKREIEIIQKDMSALREQHGREMKSEMLLREEFQQREYNLQHQVSIVQDKLDIMSIDYNNMKDVYERNMLNTKREQEQLNYSHTQRVSDLEQENEQLLLRSNVLLNTKTQELTDKYNNCLGEVEGMALETAMKKVSAEHNTLLFQMQQQCTKSIEDAHAMDLQKYTHEIERIHSLYRGREAQTDQDLKQLESVYNTRINKLEHQINIYREKMTSAESELDTYRTTKAHELNNLIDKEKIHSTQIKQFDLDVSRLNQDLGRANHVIQELTHKEHAYREQCKNLLEEQKSLRDENYQSKIKIQQLTGELTIIQKQTQLYSTSNSTVNSSLQIAQQEIQMLENELNRYKHENKMLSDIVNRSDHILYGGNNNTNSTLQSTPFITTSNTSGVHTKNSVASMSTLNRQQMFGIHTGTSGSGTVGTTTPKSVKIAKKKVTKNNNYVSPYHYTNTNTTTPGSVTVTGAYHTKHPSSHSPPSTSGLSKRISVNSAIKTPVIYSNTTNPKLKPHVRSHMNSNSHSRSHPQAFNSPTSTSPSYRYQ